jgi:UDP-glucose 4-epimerase
MKVMITGGAGYIGNELVYRLSAEPGIEDILVYDNLCKGNYNLFTGLRKVPGNNVRFIQADVLDSRSLQELHAGHGRGDSSGRQSGNDALCRPERPRFRADQPLGNGRGRLHGRRSRHRPAHLPEHTGGLRAGRVQSTDHPRVPSSFYGLSKMRGEDHVLRLMEKIPVQLVRCANVYGYSKNLRFETLVNQFVFDAHFTNRVSIHGDPGIQRRTSASTVWLRCSRG